jgi:6-pyruvoyl tetrahydropterin synthase/QueD family protein
MNMIRVTKEFTFEMAHALYGHDGMCKNIHGHSYHLSVTLIGKPIANDNSPKNGMVIDFSFLKSIVIESIIREFDHALVLNKNSPHKLLTENADKSELLHNVLLVPYQPTCENLLIDFAARINRELLGEHKLFSLKLRETQSSYAEWFSEDN